MKRLTIEIHGTGTHNRGAELMAIAIATRLRSSFPGVRLVVPPHFGSFESRAHHGFWTTTDYNSGIRAKFSSKALVCCSRAFKERMGIVSPGQVDVVIDASGFAFSDQWGPGPARKLLKKMTGSIRSTKPLILMPQAFGPFKDPVVRDLTRRLTARASLVCARESTSYNNLRELAVPDEKLRLFPDFTLGTPPEPSSGVELPDEFAAVVPNIRMVDKGKSGSEYLEFLGRVVSTLRRRNMSPCIVLHDAAGDRKVVDMLESEDRNIPIISHEDPRVLKWILGKATVVVASRFHALVSSLSQGIPCIGAGWSHKYPELFADFGCPELLIADLSDGDLVESTVDRVGNEELRGELRGRIAERAVRIKDTNEVMWREVEDIIRSVPCDRP